MKRNEGTLDRIIRIILGVILLAVGIWCGVTGALMWVLIVIGAIALITGLIGWCGLYALCGCTTCKVKAPEKPEEKPPA